ncbi:MAG TPA: hypothetical protein PLX80_11955, partial [Ignavibacteria bacterium]|nr:hypothetical protein [Ignavibacteria bacterium]
MIIVFSLSITVPQLHFLNDISVKVFIFLTVIIMGFSFSKITEKKFNQPDLLELLFLLVTASFLISSFYVNFDDNFNLFS